MEKARCNTELYSNLRAPLNNVKPSNFWGSHHFGVGFFYMERELEWGDWTKNSMVCFTISYFHKVSGGMEFPC